MGVQFVEQAEIHSGKKRNSMIQVDQNVNSECIEIQDVTNSATKSNIEVQPSENSGTQPSSGNFQESISSSK